MRKFISFGTILLNLFTEGVPPSIKRVAGFGGWICGIILVFLDSKSDLVEPLIYTSALLMGLDAIMSTTRGVFQKRNNVKGDV